jgi:hypothetical protein
MAASVAAPGASAAATVAQHVTALRATLRRAFSGVPSAGEEQDWGGFHALGGPELREAVGGGWRAHVEALRAILQRHARLQEHAQTRLHGAALARFLAAQREAEHGRQRAENLRGALAECQRTLKALSERGAAGGGAGAQELVRRLQRLAWELRLEVDVSQRGEAVTVGLFSTGQRSCFALDFTVAARDARVLGAALTFSVGEETRAVEEEVNEDLAATLRAGRLEALRAKLAHLLRVEALGELLPPRVSLPHFDLALVRAALERVVAAGGGVRVRRLCEGPALVLAEPDRLRAPWLPERIELKYAGPEFHGDAARGVTAERCTFLFEVAPPVLLHQAVAARIAALALGAAQPPAPFRAADAPAEVAARQADFLSQLVRGHQRRNPRLVLNLVSQQRAQQHQQQQLLLDAAVRLAASPLPPPAAPRSAPSQPPPAERPAGASPPGAFSPLLRPHSAEVRSAYACAQSQSQPDARAASAQPLSPSRPSSTPLRPAATRVAVNSVSNLVSLFAGDEEHLFESPREDDGAPLSAAQRGLHLAQLPLRSLDALAAVARLLRQHAAFNELLLSCFASPRALPLDSAASEAKAAPPHRLSLQQPPPPAAGAGAGRAPLSYNFEVAATPPHELLVTALHPAAAALFAVAFLVDADAALAAEIRGAAPDAPVCSDAFATRALRASRSVPATLSCIMAAATARARAAQ